MGTGESWVRNSVGVGDGVYRTVDGGDKWLNLGLKGSERIAEIIIHPVDPATVYVAAMGPLWGPGDERGLFRTRDGGATWQNILFVDDTTGCVDIALDPADPVGDLRRDVAVPALAEFLTSGGPGSGLHKSIDGGDSWQKLGAGLPAGDLGRIAIAIAPSQPATVYAVVEAERKADLLPLGRPRRAWTRTNDDFAGLDSSLRGQFRAHLHEHARFQLGQPRLPARHDAGLPMFGDPVGGADQGILGIMAGPHVDIRGGGTIEALQHRADELRGEQVFLQRAFQGFVMLGERAIGQTRPEDMAVAFGLDNEGIARLFAGSERRPTAVGHIAFPDIEVPRR